MLHFLQLCHLLAKVLFFTIRSAPPGADCLLFVLLQHEIYIFYDPLLSYRYQFIFHNLYASVLERYHDDLFYIGPPGNVMIQKSSNFTMTYCI